MSILGNDEIFKLVDVCAEHVLKGSKASIVEDKAVVALIKNVLINLNDIASALGNIDVNYANRS